MQKQQGQNTQALLQLATQLHPQTVELYRLLHLTPEYGLQEYNTSAIIREALSSIPGLEVSPPIKEVPTAVIATLTPPEYESTVLLRCELDALPFKQQSGVEFASKNGFHHACGHDGHMAVLVGALRIMGQRKDGLKRRVMAVFQPGEEGREGAKTLFQHCSSLTEAVQQCYALHFHNALLPGCLQVDSGPVTALSSRFTITISGKSAHCLAPQAGIDANYLGCALVTQLYSLSSMTVPPLEGSSLVIYKVEGGSNIAKVSDCFVLSGSLRTFSTSSYSAMKEKITKITENFCDGYGGKSTIAFQEGCYRPVVNSESVVLRVRSAVERTGQFKLLSGQRSFAGEDFCEFSQRKPSCYMSLGSALAGSIESSTGESRFPAHSSKHKISEQSLLWGVKLWLTIMFM